MLKNLKIGTKILIAFSSIAILSVVVMGVIAFSTGRTTLQEEAFNKLTAVREMKANQIEDYFQQITNQIITFSADRMIVDAMRAFDDGLHDIEAELTLSDEDLVNLDARLYQHYENSFLSRLIPNLMQDVSVPDYWPEDERSRILQHLYITTNPNMVGSKHYLDNAGDGSRYSQVHELYHPIIRDYLERFGYYDIFLIDNDTGGHIAYSVFKEVDYGTSLLDGPYADTNFAEVYRAAREATNQNAVFIADFEPYEPSYNAQVAFIASPIFDGGKNIGVLVFQMPVDRINNIMTNNQQWANVGLGESGETYIVGDDNLIRNQSRFFIDDRDNYFRLIEELGVSVLTIERMKNLASVIRLQRINTPGTEAALSGEEGTMIFPDYRGVSVLSSYRPLDIPGLNWVIMSEIDEQEAFAPITQMAVTTIMGAALLIIVIVAFSFFFSRSITTPLNALTEHANALAQGKLDEAVTFQRKDEIGILAGNFDTMRQSIKTLIDELEEVNAGLEEEVAERTAELALSERKAASIIDKAADGIIVIDKASTIITWNPSAEKMFGYPAEEMLGQSLSAIMPEDYVGLHQRASTRAGETGQLAHPGVTHELEGLRKDGTIFSLELSIGTWELAGETYFSGILRDITERKAMQRAIDEANERIRSVVENAADAIITIDQHQHITLFNPTAEAIFGYMAEEVVGNPLTVLMSEDSRSIHPAEVDKFSEEDVTARNMDSRRNITGQRKDGSIFPAEASISKMVVNGETFYTAFFRDITERKAMEAQLQEAFAVISQQKERMEDELNIAREIQLSMLPLIFPAFPNRQEIGVHAALESAREVGGDFYDFYFTDEEHFCFIIGDVSGKGAPGALFMAVAKTLIKSRAMDDSSPASILTYVNNELARDNEACMFVTAFIVILNVNTGEFVYTNASHNPPYIKREHGGLERLDERHGPIVGGMENMVYLEETGQLFQGDMILLYTDGVTEAMDINEALFNEKRLVDLLNTRAYEDPEDLTDTILQAVMQFQSEAEQADDITILTVQFNQETAMTENRLLAIDITNDHAQMAVVEEQFETFCEQHALSASLRQKISIVLDELLNNVISYAYPDGEEHIIEIRIAISGKRLVVTITDDGVPFNPFGSMPPNTALTMEEREEGGLGLFLVKQMMDEHHYQRQINNNVVTLVKLIE